jgi:hypothetical protein
MIGNPIGKAQVTRSEVPTRKYEVRGPALEGVTWITG